MSALRILLLFLCFITINSQAYSESCIDLVNNKKVLSVPGCPFCSAYRSNINQEPPEHFDKTVIIYSRHRNFFLKVQRGGFLPGSILIVSKTHQLTRISDMNDDLFNEFFEFYKVIAKHIKDTFGISHFIAFENGTVGSNTTEEANLNDQKGVCRPDGGGCLSHFHWHINPLETRFLPSQTSFEIPQEAKKMDSWQHFREFMFNNLSKVYTLIEYEGELYFIDRSVHKRRSEWIRLLISIHLKEEGVFDKSLSYSWRVQQNDDISIQTLTKLRRRYGFEHMPILPEE